MRIAVCDDDEAFCGWIADNVKNLVLNGAEATDVAKNAEAASEYAEAITKCSGTSDEYTSPHLQIDIYHSGDALLAAENLPDILLLDIRMDDTDGMAVAKTMRNNGWRGVLIFITGEADAVYDAFDVRAFHFLVKPFSKEKLKKVLSAAIAEVTEACDHNAHGDIFEGMTDGSPLESGISGRLSPSTAKWIEVQSNGVHIRVELADIVYAEVFDRRTVIHTLREDITYYGQLSPLAERLGADFFRIHRSFLVHFRYIERYSATAVILTGGTELPMSRKKYSGFLKAYLAYGKRFEA